MRAIQLLFPLLPFTQPFHSPSTLPKIHFRKSTTTAYSMPASSCLIESISSSLTAALDRPVNVKMTSSGQSQFVSSGTLTETSTSTRFFYKSSSSPSSSQMLLGEYEGIKAMRDTDTIGVPSPICIRVDSPPFFAVYSYLNLSFAGDEFEKGRRLALMHRCLSPNSMHGFHVPNTIGDTPQDNAWSRGWAEFYVERRFKAILSMCNNLGYNREEVEKCAGVIAEELTDHDPEPSLLHGDLWGGNSGYADGEPVIFDPATYYGDREADLAMTYLFGGYGEKFYEGYESEWPIEEGFERRKTIYNLYHISNHYLMFGGMYYNQARQMFESILNNAPKKKN